MMKQTGINMVRIGEFWWSRIEPYEGRYDTRYTVDLLDLLHENGLEVVMCTSTPTPPMPFINERSVGRGKIVMIGSMPLGQAGESMWLRLISHYGAAAGMEKIAVSEGTLAIPRHDDDSKYIVAVNMDGKGGIIELAADGRDMLADIPIEPGAVVIEPFGYKIIKIK